jgi:hypothetical protein
MDQYSMKKKYKIEHIDKHYYVSKRFLLAWLFEIDPKTGWQMQFNTFDEAQKYIDEEVAKNAAKPLESKGSYIPSPQAIRPPKEKMSQEEIEKIDSLLQPPSGEKCSSCYRGKKIRELLQHKIITPESLSLYLKSRAKNIQL